ncbi:hypothetical protein M409DRAFT_58488 [Zasmidium cellare ATCC 36951]|uniref:Xylanolytic transcriptional activator regulatory domain-containing protein n=1 Tax=Zasmidium cellare ATCC 36951 TaxID=1080233 RepID=A0A6A6C9B1_ZASCE|nr:uncharacterized protein M409DRAFT_58488 [Zasmidium cellare ATCC 36951]KAF2162026.1 hypothetical protein M409DRAFT_58488 [Zasmidium cellare ATCC 36951]
MANSNSAHSCERCRVRKCSGSEDGPAPDPPILRKSPQVLRAKPVQIPRPLTPRSFIASSSESGDEFMRNPMTGSPPTVHADSGGVGQQWYLGPSSTWSFSRRVTRHFERALAPDAANSLPINLDGAAYDLPPLPPRGCFDRASLPSLDHAIYLFNTVKFHLNQRFRLVDEQAFTETLHAFYRGGETSELSPLAYAELMFVLAFGKAFLPSSKPSSAPKGWVHAAQAFAALPTFHTHDQDNVLAIEVYCLAALYLQSIDMRVTAHDFIGRALRLCYVVGIHRDFHGTGISEHLASRCAELWWSVYMLDLHISALMGAPSAIQDHDMTVPIPPTKRLDARASALGIHVTLSRVLAKLMRTVYAVQSPLDGSYLADAQDVLKALADLSQDMDSSVAMSSLLSSHLSLYHHYCVVLATRPIVSKQIRPPALAGPAAALLQACLHSAMAIISTLGKLQEEDLLETFLPFHLEQVFSSAYVLFLVQKLMPPHFDLNDSLMKSDDILQAMIAGGNRLARVRMNELAYFRDMLTRFNVDSGDRTRSRESQTDSSLIPDDDMADFGCESWTTLGLELGNDGFRSSDLQALTDFLELEDVSGHIMFSSLRD